MEAGSCHQRGMCVELTTPAYVTTDRCAYPRLLHTSVRSRPRLDRNGENGGSKLSAANTNNLPSLFYHVCKAQSKEEPFTSTE